MHLLHIDDFVGGAVLNCVRTVHSTPAHLAKAAVTTEHQLELIIPLIHTQPLQLSSLLLLPHVHDSLSWR